MFALNCKLFSFKSQRKFEKGMSQKKEIGLSEFLDTFESSRSLWQERQQNCNIGFRDIGLNAQAAAAVS